MTLEQLIAQARAALSALLAERSTVNDQLRSLRSDPEATDERVEELVAARRAKDAEIDVSRSRLDDLEAEQTREDALATLQARVGSVTPLPKYDGVIRQGATSEERTYAIHKERGFDSRTDQMRKGFRPGCDFERDVARAFLGDWEAQARLAQHQREERIERGDQLERAAGTGAFAGLTVPQYLTDFYAPAAAAMRPLADAANGHVLPPDGMTVNISRITTATSVAAQANQNDAVSETNIDDTLLTLNVKTAAGQQTLSRQAIERGTGVESVVLDDLFRRYATNLDSTLITEGTTGLSAAATAIAYTDGTPTVAELFPKFAQGLAAVEAALLDQATGENLIVMHSRRWYWLQNALGTSFPLMGQPGFTNYQQGVNFGVKYGSGFRGILPNGAPVVVDNNIATNTGAGTEDEIYILDANEAHLWEDPAAPVFIRAEQTAAASLGVLLVVYGYFAYTFQRYSHAQKIGGTGLIAPTFTGV